MRSRLSAFTLVELLVVISIIGLLAGFSIPAIQGGIAKADQAACMNNLKGIGQSLNLYVSEMGTFPVTQERGRGANWQLLLNQSGGATLPTGYSINKGKNGYWYCPSALKCQVPHSDDGTTYGYNPNIASVRPARLAAPSKVAAIMDGHYNTSGRYVDATPPSQMPRPVHPPTKQSNSPTAGINVCFVDGHVEMRKLSALPTQTNDIFWSGQE